MVISIDPDSNGALAVVQVQQLPAEDACEIADASVTLYDNPCQILQTRTGGKRRSVAPYQPSEALPACSAHLQQELFPPSLSSSVPAATVTYGTNSPCMLCPFVVHVKQAVFAHGRCMMHAVRDACCRQADSRAVAGIIAGLAAQHSAAGTRVVLEQPRFNPTNGMFSAYSTGYSYGVWHGALACHGFLVRAWLPRCTPRTSGAPVLRLSRGSLLKGGRAHSAMRAVAREGCPPS